MSVNLLDLFTSGIGKDFGALASQALSESSGATSSALGAAIPTLLAGLMKSGSSSSGASSLLSMLNGPQVNSGLLDNIGGLFSGGQGQNPLMAAGGPLLGMLFGGEKVGGIANALGSMAGIKSGSASGLLTMAAPLIFGMLKKYVSGNNVNASGLQSLLAGQAKHLGGGKLNDSILSAAGLGSSSSFLGGFSDMARNAMGSAAAMGSTATAGAAAAATAGKSGIARFLPWLIGAAVLLLALSQMRSCGTQKAATTPPPAPAPVATPKVEPAPVVTAPATPAAPVVAKAPELFQVFFETGSVALPASVGDSVKAFADYAKSSPNTKIGISGFNDKTGDPVKNAELSKNRAKAVRDFLVNAGVPEDRIMLKKPDDTTGAADDKQARRVDVYVVQ
jgi:OmpA-OmpF porin, OOP family